MSTSSEVVPDKAPMKKAPVTVETRKQSVDMQKKADEIDRRAWCTASSTRRGVWGTLSSPPAETVSKSAESRETASQILICVSLSDDTLGPKSMLFQKFVVQVHTFSEAAMLWRHHPCPALHTHLAGQTVAVVVCRYGKVSRAGTNREPTSGGRHVSVRCGWSGRAQMPHLLHGWRGDHGLGTLLSVVSFPRSPARCSMAPAPALLDLNGIDFSERI